MQKRPVTERLDIPYASMILYSAIAAAAAVPGYLLGYGFVVESFDIAGLDAVFLGAVPGALAAFGVALVTLLNLSRMQCMKSTNAKVTQCSNKISAWFSAPKDGLGEYKQVLLPERNMLVSKAKDDNVKIFLLGVTHLYASVFMGVGAAVWLPLYMMYSGYDLEANSTTCYATASVAIPMQIGLFVAFARAANPTMYVGKQDEDDMCLP